ncbi:radical SAM protein [Clostridium saccharobutylicum]|uniref:Cyclic pyranopterin monophosphate synthase n=1 Tax=Clostridium saccharobutylicum TaxID=169679 RepID=A0A1S8NIF7_CLOSA|nr:radical SAM protein [Clostridium saccharobutylicum]OOM16264.1 cyclic pyranopterin monophosphate synthase [Clostridium saccharobutylicum]
MNKVEIINKLNREEVIEYLKAEGVIIYGFGRVGKNVLKAFNKHGIPVKYIWDINAKDLNNNSQEPNYDYNDKNVLIILTLSSETLCKSIEKEFLKYGFTNILNYSNEIISHLLCGIYPKFDPRICNKCLVDGGGCKEYKKNLLNYSDGNNKLILDRLSLTITTKCTLKCKDCCRYTNLYEKHMHKEYNFDEFSECWHKFLYSVKYIYQVGVAGGELFLHKDLKRILELLINTKKVGVIYITTNATVKLEKEVIEILKNEKIVVQVDLYGNNLSNQIQNHNGEFIGKLIENNITYSIIDNENGTWYDFGDFSDRKRNVEQLKDIYNKCCRRDCFEISPDYNFVICGRQSTMKDLKVMNEKELDSVDLKNNSEIEIENKINNLINKEYLDICNYCDGSDEKNIVRAGVQQYF